MNNIQEVKARGGRILIISMEDIPGVDDQADELIYLPAVDDFFGPALAAVCLQLISYYTAVYRDCPVDKPRNLAKSVTVE